MPFLVASIAGMPDVRHSNRYASFMFDTGRQRRQYQCILMVGK